MATISKKEAPLKELFASGLLWAAQPNAAQEEGPSADSSRGNFKSIPLGIDEIDSKLPGGGLRCGGTHDLFYPENAAGVPSPPYIFSALLAGRALKSASKEKSLVIWISSRPFPAPQLLQETLADKHGSLSHCIFINPPSFELLIWSLETALRSLAAAAVVAEVAGLPLGVSCRLSAAAESSGALGLILKDEKLAGAPSASLSAWKISPYPGSSQQPAWRLNLLRQKGAKFREDSWTVEANFERGKSNEKGESLSLHLFSGPRGQDLGVDAGDRGLRRRANSSL